MTARAVALLALASATSAGAEVVVWPTYLRSGPSRSAVVIGELQRDQPVTLDRCQDGWCRVVIERRSGFVEQGHVGGGATPSTIATTPVACFPSVRAGYESGESFVYCPVRSAAPLPAGSYPR